MVLLLCAFALLSSSSGGAEFGRREGVAVALQDDAASCDARLLHFRAHVGAVQRDGTALRAEAAALFPGLVAAQENVRSEQLRVGGGGGGGGAPIAPQRRRLLARRRLAAAAAAAATAAAAAAPGGAAAVLPLLDEGAGCEGKSPDWASLRTALGAAEDVRDAWQHELAARHRVRAQQASALATLKLRKTAKLKAKATAELKELGMVRERWGLPPPLRCAAGGHVQLPPAVVILPGQSVPAVRAPASCARCPAGRVAETVGVVTGAGEACHACPVGETASFDGAVCFKQLADAAVAPFGSEPPASMLAPHAPPVPPRKPPAGGPPLTLAPRASKLRVAICMGGFARSFVAPKVHRSIKEYVLDALGGSADVFMRVSKEDSVHGDGIGSKGKKVAGVDQGALKAAMGALNPVRSEYFSPSTEQAEMRELFPGRRHEVFRRLDPRRYSMWYNRYKAFLMATKYAAEQGFEYHWFAMVRFDGIFVLPLPPLESFAPDRVWAPDIWVHNVPDTFALVPGTAYGAEASRRMSEAYFGMETRVNVACLGGPDFPPVLCGPDGKAAFEQGKGDAASKQADLFKDAAAAAAELKPMCCPDEQSGVSETILQRCLAPLRPPVALFRAAVTIARPASSPDCWRFLSYADNDPIVSDPPSAATLFMCELIYDVAATKCTFAGGAGVPKGADCAWEPPLDGGLRKVPYRLVHRPLLGAARGFRYCLSVDGATARMLDAYTSRDAGSAPIERPAFAGEGTALAMWQCLDTAFEVWNHALFHAFEQMFLLWPDELGGSTFAVRWFDTQTGPGACLAHAAAGGQLKLKRCAPADKEQRWTLVANEQTEAMEKVLSMPLERVRTAGARGAQDAPARMVKNAATGECLTMAAAREGAEPTLSMSSCRDKGKGGLEQLLAIEQIVP